MRLFHRSALLLVCLTAIAGVALGQGNTGVLTGTVMTDGAPLPGVTVTIESPALQGTRTAVTNENGAYFFPVLPPGRYTVQFSLAGMTDVTRTAQVTLAQTQRLDAEMRVAAVAEAITVTASAPSVVETTDLSANFDGTFIENLPTARTITATASLAPGVSGEGPNDQLMISGAPSYENLYLVDGAVANDSIRGQPESVYIEDAIEETTVLTGNVSAEYGRFTGGVISAITKSGGNEFSGSLRDNLTNDSWTNKTPYPGEPDPLDELNEVYEATFGGRIVRDRLWFFTAGRLEEFSEERVTRVTDIPYTFNEDETRWEAKFTGSLTPKHNLVFSYLDRLTEQTGRGSFTFVDLRSLDDRELPNTLWSVNYNGIFADNLLLEAAYSEREFAFVGSGADSTDRIEGTIIRDIPNFYRAWSPTFCGICGDKTRDNEYWRLKAGYFLATGGLGTHNLIAGLEDFSELRNENNEQGGSGYRVWGEFAIQGQDVFIRVLPEQAFIQNWPVLERSQTSDSTTRSAFINDKWQLNDRWSFNLGLRYDQNDAVDQAGRTTSDDSGFSPRLGAIFDVFGDGRHRVFGGYNRYVAKLDNGINDEASTAGSPALFAWNYFGPAINENCPPTCLPTDEVLRQVFAWFDSIGGDQANPDRSLDIPGLSTQIPNGLDSPFMDELSLGYGFSLGRGFLRGDYITREWGSFYTDMTNLQTGKATSPSGEVSDVTFVTNSDDRIERAYDAIQIQGGYRFTNRFQLGGNYTWSELRGNADSETSNNATITLSSTQDFPEYLDISWNNPVRALSGDVEHRAHLWLTYDLPTAIGNFNVSLLQSYNSGFPYYASGSIDVRGRSSFYGSGMPGGVTNPGYERPPSSVTYWFMDEGEFRTDDVTRTDLGVNYALPLAAVNLFVQADVINLFDEDAIADPSNIRTTVFTHRNSACRQADGSRCVRFNPMAGDEPVRGTHYVLHDDFGEATGPNAYQRPLTYRFSVGVRF